ncbi:hypothetical protein AMELA_G00174640 [Ameiurus melas]|uniref:Uncharacterized protein n=1 Tax=Ameiurus melas TaxID=219545 RepID=A0A7J6ACR9_AMEME|nr:hypothetical protein AMELA_G00174640 [Ameiurus melas]
MASYCMTVRRLRTEPPPHSVGEDRVRTPGRPGGSGDRERPYVPASASGPRGHAGRHGADGHAAVHQQRPAQSIRALHHPLRPPDRGPERRSPGPAEGHGVLV